MGKLDRVWLPPSVLVMDRRDEEGFQIWKQFGSWNIEVCESGIIANWPKGGGYVWFGIERCWENDWIAHFEKKASCTGCNVDCRAEEKNEAILATIPRTCSCGLGVASRCHQIACSYFDTGDYEREFHRISDLHDALSFLRKIYRDPSPGIHWWQNK